MDRVGVARCHSTRSFPHNSVKTPHVNFHHLLGNLIPPSLLGFSSGSKKTNKKKASSGQHWLKGSKHCEDLTYGKEQTLSEHFRKQAKPADHPRLFVDKNRWCDRLPQTPMAFHPEEDHRRRQKKTEEHTESSPRRRWTRIFFFCSPHSLEPKFCLNESDFFFLLLLLLPADDAVFFPPPSRRGRVMDRGSALS